MDHRIENEAERIRKADRFQAYVAIRPDQPSVGNGPLSDVTIAVKDNIAVANLPFTAGHPLFKNRVAKVDAEAVRRLRSAGGRVMGVTKTDAGGFGVMTPGVENPVAPGFTAGGSSGGAAAAVAAGLADIGLGTDTGGSVRIPAACCRLFAFKPSYGLVPLDDVWPLAPSLDHIGLLARDFDLLVSATSVLLKRPMAANPGKPRFGIDMTRVQQCDPHIMQDFLSLIQRIRGAGFTVDPIALPDWREVIATHATLVLSEARTVYAGLRLAERVQLGEAAQQALSVARQLDQKTIERGRARFRKIIEEFKAIFGHVDAILTPTLPVPAPRSGASTVLLDGKQVPTVVGLVAETCLTNLAGSPTLVLPMEIGTAPRPVSLQIIAPRDADVDLLQYGAWLQAAVVSEAKGGG